MNIETREARHVHPAHPVYEADKVTALVESMRRDGWVGEPLLVIGDQAWTGSHRIAAACEAGIHIKVYPWDPTADQVAALAGEVDEYGAPRDQESMILALEALAEEDADLDSEALRLYRVEAAK